MTPTPYIIHPKPYTQIVREPIDVRALEAKVSGVANGAVCTFIGQVRNNSRGREVAYLEYDAYVPMAEKMLRQIALEASEKWRVELAIEQRNGRIELGEASVVVCAGAPHRGPALEAWRSCVATLKDNVPIWEQ